jgi:UDP-glucuronate 4-epimerase
MHILTTGAACFIGSALALRLLERGERVTGLDNLNHHYDVRHGVGALAGSEPDTIVGQVHRP